MSKENRAGGIQIIDDKKGALPSPERSAPSLKTRSKICRPITD